MHIGGFASSHSSTTSLAAIARLADARAADQAPAPAETGSALSSGTPEKATELRLEQARLRLEKMEIADLAARDREVRVHEQAHASVGGALAGSPTYSYTRGPDGRSYVTDGEVSIDTSPVAGNPQATLEKMDQVRRAALAPAEPSVQDMRVAAQAQATAAQARGELVNLRSEENRAGTNDQEQKSHAGLGVYRTVGQGADAAAGLVDETA